MNEQEKFNGTSLLEKEVFYKNLNMQDVTDSNNMLAKRVCKDVNLGEYHHYLKSDRLLFADVFENVEKMCLEIYQLDPAKFFPDPGLV